jgi:hypothetical protein
MVHSWFSVKKEKQIKNDKAKVMLAKLAAMHPRQKCSCLPVGPSHALTRTGGMRCD